MAEQKISMIHPNLYNKALKKFGIDGLTVKDGDNGLQIEYGLSGINDVLGKLVNNIVSHFMLIDLVLPSNTSRLKQLRAGLSDFTEVTRLDDEDKEWLDELIDTLDGVISNLEGVVSDVG